MLEQLRQNSRSFIIWILFGIIILAFVFTFGSQGGLQFEGCAGSGSSWVMEVQGRQVSEHSWRFGRNTLGRALQQQGRQRPMSEAQIYNAVLDRLLAREILANAASDAGFQVTDDLIVQEYLTNGKFWTLGEYNDLLNNLSLQFGQNTGFMKPLYDNSQEPPKRIWERDDRLLEATVHSWGLPNIDMFIDEQKREVMAEFMRRTIRASAVASEAEARLLFEQEKTTAKLQAVIFRAFDYRDKIRYTDADVAAYLMKNEQAVRASYDENERLYKERKPQIRIRQMVFMAPEPVPETPEAEAGADSEGAEGGASADAQEMSGREAADAAYQRLQQGADFAQLAAELSQDERTSRSGGDLGWRSAELPGMGAPELTEAVKSLEAGSYSGIIGAGDRFYIVFVESKREGGDLSFDDVKMEIAAPMMLEEYSKAMARRAAEEALAKVQGGAKLDELFDAAPTAPSMPQGLTPDMLQNLSPEQLQQLLNRQGSLTVETRDFQAQAEVAVEPAAPTSGTADATADAGKAATGAAPGKVGSSGDMLVSVPDDVPAPKLQTIGPFPREMDGRIPGIGKVPTLIEAAFKQLDPGQVFGQVVDAEGKYVVAKLVERSTAKDEEFDDRTKRDYMERISNARASDAIAEWLDERCKALTSGGKVTINNSKLRELIGQNDDEEPYQYRACGYLYDR